MADELSHAARAVEAGAEALIQDVVATLRNHPQYASLVNGLVEKAVTTLAAEI